MVSNAYTTNYWQKTFDTKTEATELHGNGIARLEWARVQRFQKAPLVPLQGSSAVKISIPDILAISG